MVMIKVDVVFTEDEAVEVLRSRGLVVAERTLTGYEGEYVFVYEQKQVKNPFTGEWDAVEYVFRRLAERVVEEVIRERILSMDLHECF